MSGNSLSSFAIYLIPLALLLLTYVARRKKIEATASETWSDAVEAGLTEPSSLHPLIDAVKCLGAGGCITACPEGALGLIGGHAFLVNPSVCIGHGACAAACPHDAISLVFGTEKRGMDIPQVSPNFETNVPGIFIAGELGGMGLIRKAALQGTEAIRSIEKFKHHGNSLDVVIIGAGPAGLAATLGCVQAKLRYVTIEQEPSLGGAIYQYPRNKIAMTAPVKLPVVGDMKLGETSKENLLGFWEDVVARTGARITFNERMEGITRADDGFIVKTTRGTYRTRTVLLAIGRRGTPRKLNVPGEDLPKVVYRLIDEEQYRNMRVLVVGGGDSALEAACSIAEQPGTTVALSYRGEAFGRCKQKNRNRLTQLEQRGRIKVMLNSNVTKIDRESVSIESQGQIATLANDAVIICAGGILPTPLLREIGVMVETKYGTL